MLVLGMGAVAAATQAVERRASQSRAEIAVRNATPRGLRQIEAEIAGKLGGRPEKAFDPGLTPERRSVDPALDLEPDVRVERAATICAAAKPPMPMNTVWPKLQ